MMRVPWFGFYSPKSVAEAARMLAAEGAKAMLIAGGTDLVPNMKRRQQTPATLISLRQVEGLRKISNGSGLTLGAGLTLSAVASAAAVRGKYHGLAQAAAQVATPHLRNMGTLGGNICLDTRCLYYNQNYEWRKAIDFCMKKDGHICWVAPSSPRCWAVSSSDVAPVLVAMGAELVLVGPHGERVVPAARLYNNDGIDYLTKHRDEILAEVRLPAPDGWDAVYRKLRRRGSFDFPVLGVAAWVRWDGRTIADARVVLGGVASWPQEVAEAGTALVGSDLSDEAIAAAAEAAYRPAKPLDNTDFDLSWRKQMTRVYVKAALEELRERRR